MQKNSDMPAYPESVAVDQMGDIIRSDYHGLTKRERIAVAAMQGLISSPVYQRLLEEMPGDVEDAVAGGAVAHADALLEALQEQSDDE